jgi:hypothetical protein
MWASAQIIKRSQDFGFAAAGRPYDHEPQRVASTNTRGGRGNRDEDEVGVAEVAVGAHRIDRAGRYAVHRASPRDVDRPQDTQFRFGQSSSPSAKRSTCPHAGHVEHPKL